MFTRTGSVWSQQGEKLIGSGGSGAPAFGESVALSADGNTAVIGGPNDDGDEGAVWIFTRSGTTWSQAGGKVTGGREGGTGFGDSVALSPDGTTALVGDAGAARAFVLVQSGSSWVQQGTAIEDPESSERCPDRRFGSSVALSGNGRTALIGAEYGCATGQHSGDAWVFELVGASWTPEVQLKGGSGGFAGFGRSVALSNDGTPP